MIVVLWNNKTFFNFKSIPDLHDCTIKIEGISISYSSSYNLTPTISRVLIGRQFFFAHPRDQRAVIHLKNVHQLNTRRGKKLGLQLSHIDNLILENWSVFHYLLLNNIYEDIAKTSKALLHFFIKVNLPFSYHLRP